MKFIKWLASIVEDNSTGEPSSTKVAYILGFLIVSIIVIALTIVILGIAVHTTNIADVIKIFETLLKFLTIYTGIFAATATASKVVRSIFPHKIGDVEEEEKPEAPKDPPQENNG